MNRLENSFTPISGTNLVLNMEETFHIFWTETLCDHFGETKQEKYAA